MTLFLLDNSVQQRLDRSVEVRQSVERLTGAGNLLASSDVLRLEAGFSAKNAADHARITDGLTNLLVLLPLTPAVGVVAVELQAALVEARSWRSIGVVDLLHAATAIVHGAVVVHYDHDYQRLADLDDRLRHQWVVPQGSVP